MADHPILFSAPMVRAILAGTKTQTRRVLDAWCDEPPAYVWSGQIIAEDENGWMYRWPKTHAVGDRLWVREAWRTLHANDCLSPRHMAVDPSKITFEADPENRNPLWAFGRLRPGMFMPRWASRITLTVTEVRVQRLQDITEEDAIAEGVVNTGRRDGAPYSHCIIPGMPEITMEHEPSSVFAALWEHINGDGSWKANPWVAAYTFTVEHRNIDAGGAHG
jgi:hypothetical protein